MRTNLAILCNLFIGIMSIGAWFFMAALVFDNGSLSAVGISSLKYFTVLSNLLNGIVSLLYASWLWRGEDITIGQRTWKLIGTSGVTLTFLTVILMLGPMFGYRVMFLGANLWMHLILPLASIFSFTVLERGVVIPSKSVLCVAPFVLLYEVGYVLNMVIHGIGEYPNSNDFYGFMSWGYGGAAIICVGMILAIITIAGTLRFCSMSKEQRMGE